MRRKMMQLSESDGPQNQEIIYLQNSLHPFMFYCRYYSGIYSKRTGAYLTVAENCRIRLPMVVLIFFEISAFFN
jgi:hypothetical protein